CTESRSRGFSRPHDSRSGDGKERWRRVGPQAAFTPVSQRRILHETLTHHCFQVGYVWKLGAERVADVGRERRFAHRTYANRANLAAPEFQDHELGQVA